MREVVIKSEAGIRGVINPDGKVNWNQMTFFAEDLEVKTNFTVDYLGMVREFHEKYGHYTSDRPFDGDKYPSFPTHVVKLREKLITEEAREFALSSYDSYDTLDNMPVNIIDIADALADLLYVVFGAALAYGIPIADVFAEVHRSNMTKSMLKDEKSVKGKTLKGDDYDPPNIRKVLEEKMK